MMPVQAGAAASECDGGLALDYRSRRRSIGGPALSDG